ncbi:MAG: ubiquinone/menaquinone biosynthesis methyltransferase [Planctomycetes bacterium]|nr:ubiquinone/menaquinone biosynthesis methyltransferase [Planctomycetota bacterium]
MDYFEKTKENKPETVRHMFDQVAPKYDCFNRILSLGLDKLWRKRAIRNLKTNLAQEGFILDMGCGSGDLAIDISHHDTVIGMDFCRGMLKEAALKNKSLPLCQGDATQLPFANNVLRGVISAFVIRNVGSLANCCHEVYRCLQPGAKVVILEFALPQNPIFRIGFLTYLKIMFPIACSLFKGDTEAYEYLRKSIQSFGENINVVEHLENAGFNHVKATPLLLGGVNMYEGIK